MNSILHGCFRPGVFAILLVLASPSGNADAAALGYVGPGAGLSMMGDLAAVLAVMLLAAAGPIVYACRVGLQWRRQRWASTLMAATMAVSHSGPDDQA